MKKKFLLGKFLLTVTLIAAFACTFIPSTASALITTDMMVTNENLGVVPAGTSFAEVTLEVSAGTAEFTVVVDPDGFLNDTGTNFGIQEFYFNTDLSLAVDDFVLPTDWSVTTGVFNVDGFGDFDVRLKADRGNARLETLYFEIENLAVGVNENNFYILSEQPAANGQGHFAAHIAGWEPALGPEEVTSAKFRDGPPPSIPEPATIILLGSGLIGLGLWGRRKFKI